MSRTPKAAPLGGFNVSGSLGDQDASPLGSGSTLFDAGGLAVPPFASGLGLPQSLGNFLPTQLPMLDLWLRADMGVSTVAVNHVTTWADQSGNHRDVSQATVGLRPDFVLGGPFATGAPALFFNAGGNLFTTSTNLTVSVGRTVFVVCYATSATNQDLFCSRMTTQFAEHAYPGNNFGFAWTDGVNIPNNCTATIGLGSGSTQILCWSEPNLGSALVFYANGVLQTSAQPSGMSAETGTIGISVGEGPSALNISNTYIAEVIVYYTQLSAASRALVTSYLKVRYGVP